MKTKNQLLIGLFFYLVFSLVLFSSGMAQVADGYNYQAVIREGDGSIRANEVALMRFTIAADSNGTNAFYSEQATLNTDQYGLVNHVIGTGSNSSGSLAGINWTVGSKYLIIELNGNAGFEEVSDDKLQAVPFASFADQADYNSLLNRPTLFDGDYNSLTNKPILFDGDYQSLANKPTLFSGDYNNLLNQPWINNGNNVIRVSGNVGIGVSAPDALLSLNGSARNKKIALYDINNNQHQFLGFGNSSGQLRYHVDVPATDHVFYSGVNSTSSLELFRITGDGKVGIGNNNPESILDIVIPGTAPNLSPRLRTNFGGWYIYSNNNTPRATFYDVAGSTNPHTGITGDGNTGLYPDIVINNNRIGIKLSTINPLYTLHVNGSAGKPGGGSWTAASDKRLKQNVEVYNDGLSSLLKIKPVTYQYNEKSGIDTEKQYVGVIAQDLQVVAPYMVGSFELEGTEYLDVDNSAMVYMLINSVQEQQLQIEELKKELVQKSNSNETLEGRLKAIEAKLIELSKAK